MCLWEHILFVSAQLCRGGPFKLYSLCVVGLCYKTNQVSDPLDVSRLNFCASGFIVFVLCHAPHMSLGLLMLIVFIVCLKNQLKHLYLDSRLTLAVFPSWFTNFEGRTTPAFVEYGNQYKHQNKKTRIQTQQTIDKVLIRRKSLSYKYLFGSPSFPMSGWIMSAKPCAMKIRLY